MSAAILFPESRTGGQRPPDVPINLCHETLGVVSTLMLGGGRGATDPIELGIRVVSNEAHLLEEGRGDKFIPKDLFSSPRFVYLTPSFPRQMNTVLSITGEMPVLCSGTSMSGIPLCDSVRGYYDTADANMPTFAPIRFSNKTIRRSLLEERRSSESSLGDPNSLKLARLVINAEAKTLRETVRTTNNRIPKIGLILDQYTVTGRSAACGALVMLAAGVKEVIILGGHCYGDANHYVEINEAGQTSSLSEGFYQIGVLAARGLNAEPS